MNNLKNLSNELLKEVMGQRIHKNEKKESSGFYGNAQLTAITGIVLLALFLLQLLTTINVDFFLVFHIFIGSVIFGFLILKTVTTFYKMISYYSNRDFYKEAGAPLLLFRLLSPLLVLTSWVLVLSGTFMVIGGNPETSLGLFNLTLVGVHGDSYVVLLILAGIHLIGRFIPALKITQTVKTSSIVNPKALHRRTLILVLTLLFSILWAILITIIKR